MDPLTFAQIVQLLAIFVQEYRARKDLTHRGFVEWLGTHRHDELKDLISENRHVSEEVDKILQQDHQLILSKLEGVSQIVADILSRIEELSTLTTILPGSGMSKQSIEIITWFVDSGATEFAVIKQYTNEPPILQALPRQDTLLGQLEERFLSDDLASLMNHGFLMQAFDRKFDCYKLTRAAVAFVEVQRGNRSK